MFENKEEYVALEKSISKNISRYGTTFGVDIIDASKDGILIGTFEENRKLSFEELKALNSKYEQLEKFIEKLTEETHIVYY